VSPPTLNHSPTADELALLRRSARDALALRYNGSPDGQWPQSWKDDWRSLDEQGLWSTIEPPDGSLTAASVVAEELGRALYPGPAYEAMAAVHVLTGLGDSEALPVVVGVAPAAVFASANSPMVQVGRETMLIVATEQDDLFTTRAVEAECYDVPSLDVTRHIVQPRFPEQPETLVWPGVPEVVRSGRAAKALLYCADTLGCVEHVLERTAEYAMARRTFGSPIGKYQAVAHRMVDHAVTAQQMRLLLDGAVAAFDERAGDLAHRVATTETYFFGRSTNIISDCIQLAGAIGFTWEFGYHFFLRRALQNTSLGGETGRPQQRLAQEAPW
jgi:alkylation response protein AidB-like acyl-CoA dehydrogenase